jgi:hyperosmotically inducible periplasmic protein
MAPRGIRLFFQTFGAVGLVFTLTACGPADRWDERPPGEGTRAEMPGAGEETNDRWITVQIQAQYFGDPDVRGRDIQVETRDGVVTLTGEVGDQEIREHVVTIARNTEGVERVEDRLRVHGEAEPTAGPEGERRDPEHPAEGERPREDRPVTGRMGDAWITTKIQARYFTDEEVRGADINVTTENGVTTLEGEVASEQVRERALRLARETDGVERVEDRLTVRPETEEPVDPETAERLTYPRHPDRPAAVQETREALAEERPEPRTDEEITTHVQARYFEDELIRKRDIDVRTSNGVVTLTGDVASEEERDRAVSLAREVEGVTDVRDELNIRPGEPTTDEPGEREPDTLERDPLTRDPARDPATREPARDPAVQPEDDSAATAPERDRPLVDILEDTWITTRIQARFFTEDDLRAGRIEVRTEDGVVTLEGEVPNEAARERAVRLAREIDGVQRVEDDRLMVRKQEDLR